MRTKTNKFGFEIEGEYSNEFAQSLTEIGSIKGDGSIRRCSSNNLYHKKHHTEITPSEFASEPIERKHLRSTKKIFDMYDKAYRNGDFHWNDTAGFHVHVSFRPKRPPEIISKEFCDFFYEKMQEKFAGALKRRKNNRYCLAMIYDENSIYRGTERYHGVNINPSLHKHGTVEFRIFPAATPYQMWKFLKFTLKTVEEFIDIPLVKKFSIDIPETEEYNRNIDYTLNMEMKEIADGSGFDTFDVAHLKPLKHNV